MSLTQEQRLALDELALLSADDAARQRWVSTLSSASDDMREYWAALEREERVVREVLAEGAPPWGMMAALLEIPEKDSTWNAVHDVGQPSSRSGGWTQRRARPRRNWREASIPWPIAAAVLLTVLGGGVAGYWQMNRPPAPVAALPAPPREAVERLTKLVIEYHNDATALQVTGSNSKEVAAALRANAGKALAFTLAIPDRPAEFHLLGGSLIPMGTQMAVYTRWENGGRAYSLFQLSPESVGMPHVFANVTELPTAVSAKSLRVMVWPGSAYGSCTWASVSDAAVPEDLCGQTY